MKRLVIRNSPKVAMIVLLVLLGDVATPCIAQGAGREKESAVIFLSLEGPSRFVLTGTAQGLGRYMSFGELEFVLGEEEGSLVGMGVAVFAAADGNLLVGVVDCQVHADGASDLTFHWRDSVEFSDGTVFSSTGRFVKHRPQGLVVVDDGKDPVNPIIRIILILFG